LRVTTNSLISNLLYDLREAAGRLETSERELSSLKRINKPSDDPVGTVNALRLKATLFDVDRYVANIQDAQSWLNATEGALASLAQVATRAMDIALRAGSGSLPESSRDALAREVDQITREAVDVANQSFGGRSLFAGYSTGVRPVTTTEVNGQVTAVAMHDDSGQMIRQIGPDSTMTINYCVTGVARGAGSSLFDALISLRQAIDANDRAALGNAVSVLEDHHSRLVGLETETGAKDSRLATTKERLDQMKLDLIALLSQVQDTDVAECTVRVQAAQNSYTTALAVGARIIMPTLVDFLK
jgi:flagellar hook-associated protein 3 FlgL